MENLEKENTKKEADIFNKQIRWEKYVDALEKGKLSMIALLELFKSGVLKPEDIVRADAERMKELKSKENLSEEEKDELEIREKGDLFYNKEYKKYAAVNFWGAVSELEEEGGIYKEVGYISESISGFLDNKEINVERMVYDIEPASLEELRTHDPKQAKLFDRAIYAGKIGDRELSEDEAKNLFEKYILFAQKRSKEIISLANHAI